VFFSGSYVPPVFPTCTLCSWSIATSALSWPKVLFPLSRFFILEIYSAPCDAPYSSRPPPPRKIETKVSARAMQWDKLLEFLTYFPFRWQNSGSSPAWITCSGMVLPCYTFISWFYSRIHTFFGRVRIALRNDPKVIPAYTRCQLQSVWIMTARFAAIKYSREVRPKSSFGWYINTVIHFLDIFHHIVACCLKAGISWTTASIASQRLAVPRQRLGKQLLSLQRMLTKVFPRQLE
jgi:hypothetical protein